MAGAGQRKTWRVALEAILLLTTIAAAAGGVFLLNSRQSDESRIAVMEQRLRDMRRLKTVSQAYRSVIYVEEKNFWRGNKQVLFTIEYEVDAGVDFSRGIRIRELSDGVIQVRMPEAEIFSSDADERTIHQMFLKEQSLFNPVSMGDYMPQVVAQGGANRVAAQNSGILQRAETNARSAVVRVLGLGGIDEVVFGPPLKASGAAEGNTPAEEDTENSDG